MALIPGIQLNNINPLSRSLIPTERSVVDDRENNNHQFVPNLLQDFRRIEEQDIDIEASIRLMSSNIAFKLFKTSDKNLFNKDTPIPDIINYYKFFINRDHPSQINPSEYDFKLIIEIILVYLGIGIDHLATKVSLSDDKIIHMNGYSIVGPGYNITKATPCKELFELTQEERFTLGSAAKLYNYNLQAARKRSKTVKNKKPDLETIDVSIRNRNGKFCQKTQIVLNQPDLVKSCPFNETPFNLDQNQTLDWSPIRMSGTHLDDYISISNRQATGGQPISILDQHSLSSSNAALAPTQRRCLDCQDETGGQFHRGCYAYFATQRVSGWVPHLDGLDREEEEEVVEDVLIRDHNSDVKTVNEMIGSDEHVHYDMLYYTTNSPIRKLAWDGSYLGNFDKGQFRIIKTQTTLGNKFMLLNINGEQFWSECTKLKENDDISVFGAIDEWKPLFGIDKIGTHFITLDKRKFMLLKPPFSGSNMPGVFKVNMKLSDVDPTMVKGDHLDQVRKILLFKYLIGSLKPVSRCNVIRFDLNNSRFSSHLDLSVRACGGSLDIPQGIINRWLIDRLSNGVDDRDQYRRILSRHLKNILNIVADEDKEIKPSILRSSMEDIGRRIDIHGETNNCISFIIGRVQDLLDCF